jgi:hypothetical protein
MGFSFICWFRFCVRALRPFLETDMSQISDFFNFSLHNLYRVQQNVDIVIFFITNTIIIFIIIINVIIIVIIHLIARTDLVIGGGSCNDLYSS